MASRNIAVDTFRLPDLTTAEEGDPLMRWELGPEGQAVLGAMSLGVGVLAGRGKGMCAGDALTTVARFGVGSALREPAPASVSDSVETDCRS